MAVPFHKPIRVFFMPLVDTGDAKLWENEIGT